MRRRWLNLACLHVTCGLLTSHGADLRCAHPVRHLLSAVSLHHELNDVVARKCDTRCRCTAAMGKRAGGQCDTSSAEALQANLSRTPEWKALHDATIRRSLNAMVSKGPEAARQWSAACGIGGIAPDADARLLSGPLASRLILLQAVQAGPELQPFLTEASSCCRFIRSDHVGINRLQFLLDSLTDLDKRCMTATAAAAAAATHRRSPSKPTFRVAKSVHLIRACLI